METRRYPIRLGMLRPLLRILKVKADTAYAELDDDGLFIRYGYIDARIPYDNITDAETRGWPFLYGIGLRMAPQRTMGYIGSYGDAAWVTLREPQKLKAGPGAMKLNRERVAISLEESVEFVEELMLRI